MGENHRRVQFVLLGVILVCVVLGAVQGRRINDMRQAEAFYRWILSATTLSAIGDTLEFEKVEGAAEPMDDELFADVVALAETVLPDDIPLHAADKENDEEDAPTEKLLRAVRYGRGYDYDVYRMLAGKRGRDLRERFQEYMREGLILSAGTQFSASSMYASNAQGESVGVTSLFFGFRKVAANFLWMQVDTYWHKGQMHRMLPLMRTTVALDPSFVDAYLLGAWHLAYNLTAKLPDTPEPQKKFDARYGRRVGPKELWYYVAADFLKDGIRKNPRDYRVYFDLGYSIYENKIHDHASAVLYLKEARRYRHDSWVPRMLNLALRRNGQYDEAIEGWLDYVEKFPDSYQAVRFIQVNRGYLAESTSEQAAECAKAARHAADRLEVEAVQADADGHRDDVATLKQQAEEARRVAEEMDKTSNEESEKAREIWTAMIDNGQDSIAIARMYRRTALEFAEKGRYLEAISQLQLARYEMLETFDETSDLIIKIKLQGGLPLTVSEKLAVEREREAAAYANPNKKKKKRFVSCPYEMPEDSDTTLALADTA